MNDELRKIAEAMQAAKKPKEVKKTYYEAVCDCGAEPDVREQPPREKRCKCGKWIAFVEQKPKEKLE